MSSRKGDEIVGVLHALKTVVTSSLQWNGCLKHVGGGYVDSNSNPTKPILIPSKSLEDIPGVGHIAYKFLDGCDTVVAASPIHSRDRIVRQDGRTPDLAPPA
jgi:hypothetical protein